MKPALIPLAVVVLAACGPATTPLKKATNVRATSWYSTSTGEVVKFNLRLEADGCPTFDAKLTVNGGDVPVVEAGGVKPTSFYFIPGEQCAPATYELPLYGKLPVQSGMSLKLTDSSATFGLESSAAFQVAVERVGTEAVHPGDMLRFHVTRTLVETSLTSATIRPVGGEALPVIPPTRSRDEITVTMPQSAPGPHDWTVEVLGSVAVDTCSGFSVCNPVGATFFGSGRLTVSP